MRDSNPRKHASSGQFLNFCYSHVTATNLQSLTTLDISSLAESEGFEPPKTIRYRKSFILNGYQLIIYVTFAYHLLHLCYANRCKNLSHKVRFRTTRYHV